MELSTHVRRNRYLRCGLAIAMLMVVAVPSAHLALDSRRENVVEAAAPAPTPLPVTAPGRIEPRDGVLAMAAPATLTGPAIVTHLHVREGDWVRQGDLLATLHGRDEHQAALIGRERRRAVAAARLAALLAGGKHDDLQAVAAEVQRDEAALAQADADARRARDLHAHGLLDSASREAQHSRLTIAARAADASRARLNGLSTVRPADIAVAEAEMRAADADVAEARAALETTVVRAPFEGRVLAVHTRPGQLAGPNGIVSMGRTSEMFVDAEVLEQDVARTRLGQAVRITGDVLASPVAGTVEEIGTVVGSRQVFATDPAVFADSRIVHVKIRAADPAPLARFIHARVTVVIAP
jgi:HlyD family secretion protein